MQDASRFLVKARAIRLIRIAPVSYTRPAAVIQPIILLLHHIRQVLPEPVVKRMTLLVKPVIAIMMAVLTFKVTKGLAAVAAMASYFKMYCESTA